LSTSGLGYEPYDRTTAKIVIDIQRELDAVHASLDQLGATVLISSDSVKLLTMAATPSEPDSIAARVDEILRKLDEEIQPLRARVLENIEKLRRSADEREARRR
jgi:hypothetical protein